MEVGDASGWSAIERIAACSRPTLGAVTWAISVGERQPLSILPRLDDAP